MNDETTSDERLPLQPPSSPGLVIVVLVGLIAAWVTFLAETWRTRLLAGAVTVVALLLILYEIRRITRSVEMTAEGLCERRWFRSRTLPWEHVFLIFERTNRRPRDPDTTRLIFQGPRRALRLPFNPDDVPPLRNEITRRAVLATWVNEDTGEVTLPSVSMGATQAAAVADAIEGAATSAEHRGRWLRVTAIAGAVLGVAAFLVFQWSIVERCVAAGFLWLTGVVAYLDSRREDSVSRRLRAEQRSVVT